MSRDNPEWPIIWKHLTLSVSSVLLYHPRSYDSHAAHNARCDHMWQPYNWGNLPPPSPGSLAITTSPRKKRHPRPHTSHTHTRARKWLRVNGRDQEPFTKKKSQLLFSIRIPLHPAASAPAPASSPPPAAGCSSCCSTPTERGAPAPKCSASVRTFGSLALWN